MPRSFKVRYIPCPVKSYNRQFTNQGGLKNHIQMHCTPKINAHLLAHELPMNDNGFPIDNIEEPGASEMNPEHENHPPNPGNVVKEKVTYHSLINGTPSHFIHSKK